MKKFVIATVLALSAASQAMAGDSLHDAIQARENGWSAAFNANDAEALGAFYEEDAVLIAPGSPPIRGRAAIADFLAGLFPQMRDMKLVTDEVRPLGPDHAVEIGHSQYTAIGEEGATSPGSDDYQVVWHRGADGVWLYVTDMFNAR